MNQYLASIILLCAGLIFSSEGMAQLKEVDLQTRIDQSTLVIEAEVISQESLWDVNQSNIYTRNTLAVSKQFKGEETADEIILITHGGIVGLDMERVSHSLQVNVGDVGVFTLIPSSINLGNATNEYRAGCGPHDFIKYDRIGWKASAPFEEYPDVENSLYPNVTAYTGQPITEVTPLDWKIYLTENQERAITSFTPMTASAGTATTITISGSGFGASAGTVRFSNGDDGGATFVDGLPTEIISWSDTQIVVEVNQSAGTGPIQVVGATTFTSASVLTVPFAQLNPQFDPGSGTESYQSQHISRNANGGYIWQMNNDFAANASASASFARGLDSWVDASCINWEIGSNVSTDVVANDNINIVRFDNGGELPSGVLGVCTSRWSGCGGATISWYVEELDIVFDDGTSWEYGPAAPSFSEYDFESVVVHELGHGHQLGHVINTSEVMHFSLTNGDMNRNISTNELAGSLDVMSRSTGTSVCGELVMTEHSSCAVVCSDPTVPTVTPSSSDLCPGGSATLTITGTLNDATEWAVYAGPCGGTLVGTTSTSSFVVMPGASTVYSIRGEDGAGCVDEASLTCATITVNVSDNDSPTISCPSNQTLSGNATCQAVLPDYTSAAIVSDVCDPSPIVSQSPSPGGMVSGTTTITLTATDANGNTASCTLSVEVEDTTPPTISCPANSTVDSNSDCEGILLDYTALAVVSDACDTSPVVTQSPPMGSTFAGTSVTVTLSATDGTGNTSECSFVVSREDNTQPTIVCPGNQVENFDGTCQFVLPDYTSLASASDNCDASPTVTQSPSAGTQVSGNTTITLTARDADFNESTCTFDVVPNDATAPVITCPGSQAGAVNSTCQYELPDYTGLVTATDNCGTPTVTQSPEAGTFVTVGTTTITMTASDGINEAICDFDLTVTDGIQPVFSICPPNDILEGDGLCMASAPDYTGIAVVTDNCSSNPTITQSPTAGTMISGLNTFVLTATDDSGNSTTCSFDVTVEGNTIFVYSQSTYCPADADPTPTISGVDGGMFSATPSGLVFSSSSGQINTVTSTPGTYTITYSLSDPCVGSSDQVVTIQTAAECDPGTSECDNAIAISTSIYGVPVWQSFALDTEESVVGCSGTADDDRWFSFVAGSTNDMVVARDPQNIYDVVIEIFDGCEGTLIGCYNNYDATGIEKALPGTFTAGQPYVFRVYDAATGASASTDVQVQVKTFTDGGLQAPYCGVLDYSLSDFVQAERDDLGQLYTNPGVPVTGYAFKFEGAGFSGVEIPSNGAPNCVLSQVGGLVYDETYDVSVAHRVLIAANGTVGEYYSNFGTSCTIGLEENIPVTQLSSQDCGATELLLSDQILADYVPGATHYRFTFVGGGQTLVKIRTNYSVQLYTVGSGSAMLEYGVAYDVTVEANIGGQWSSAGAVCTIGLDAQPPATSVIDGYCGQAYSAPSADFLYTELVYGASIYQFRITPLLGGAVVNKYTSTSLLSFNTIASTITPGSYEIDVRAYAGGQWGDYGDACQININFFGGETQDGALVDKVALIANELEMSIYPNPNAGDEFMININSTDDDASTLQVDVYDVTGKLIESHTKAVKGDNPIVLVKMNHTLSSGMYIVRARQGNISGVKQLLVR